MSATLKWVTPNAAEMIAHMARVSNPGAKPDDPSGRLIGYLIRNRHWSPFEMANICFEIETTRDISRQILRHRSFHFQEFSQRYAEVVQPEPILREARLQDHKNRQNSLVTDDVHTQNDWDRLQVETWYETTMRYQEALDMGIAKEQARALLPEGLTGTRMYMNGTVRDWFHYLSVRLDAGTQLEHRQLASEILDQCAEILPDVFSHLGAGEE